MFCLGDDRASKNMVILRQCRPLCNSSAPQSIQLVASKEEAEVAKVVEKALKNASPVRYRRNGPPYLAYSNPRVVEGVHNFNV